jgi:CubicO group peptidase (beta-lactamase class C family)
VVNVWSGTTRKQEDSAPWREDTTSLMFSVTKGLISILTHRLAQEGLLDLDRPVAYYWPEFAAAGKGEIPVRWLLQHRAGLSATRHDFSIEDVVAITPIDEALAAQEPLWKPGTGHQYHAMTFGNLVGKVISIVTGRTLTEAFQELIAEPLEAEAWVGIPATEEHRVTKLHGDGKRAPLNAPVGSDWYWIEKAMTFGKAFIPGEEGDDVGFNRADLHQAGLGGAGGIATADSLARIWSATVVETNGVRLLSAETVATATLPAAMGESVFHEPPPYNNRGDGFHVYSPGSREFLSPKGFGHDGYGGQTGWADPVNKVGFGYLTNYLKSGDEEFDGVALVEAALKQMF